MRTRGDTIATLFECLQIKRSRVRFPHWNFFFPLLFFSVSFFSPFFFLHARSAISMLKHFSSYGGLRFQNSLLLQNHLYTFRLGAVPTPNSDSSILTVVLASVITAVTTALLVTVIFVLVLIAVCKCNPTPEAEKQVESEYDSIVERPIPGSAFELQENLAYDGTHFHPSLHMNEHP